MSNHSTHTLPFLNETGSHLDGAVGMAAAHAPQQHTLPNTKCVSSCGNGQG